MLEAEQAVSGEADEAECWTWSLPKCQAWWMCAPLLALVGSAVQWQAVVLGQNVKLSQAFGQNFDQSMPPSHPQGLERSCLCAEEVSWGGAACSTAVSQVQPVLLLLV